MAKIVSHKKGRTRRKMTRIPNVGVFWTAPSTSYREPEPTRGADAPVPETRSDVLQRMQERLDKEGAFLQTYSNGEFISSSLAVSRTFEGCCGVRVLECAGSTVHYDAEKNIFWRQGGCFD